MTDLPSFTIGDAAKIFDVPGIVISGELGATGLIGADVTFTPNVPAGQFVTWGGSLYRVPPVVAKVQADGTLRRNGDAVKLLANDAGLNVDGIQWQISVTSSNTSVPFPVAVRMVPWWFDAPADGTTLNLDGAVPTPGIAIQGVALTEQALVGLIADSSSDVHAAIAAIGGGSSADEYHEYANLAAFPGTGVVDRIYLARDTGKLYRWNGSAYVQIADKTAVGLGNVDNTSDVNKPVSTAQQTALDAKQNINAVRQPLRDTCVVIGDSIAEWQSQGYLMQSYHSDMFMNHMCTDSYQRIKNAGYFCTGGYKLSDIQTNHLPTVLAMSPLPGACIIQGGLNDIANSIAFATSVSTLKAMVASLLNVGIWPILWTLPPMTYTSHPDKIIQWNDWLRRYAALNGFGLIDVYAELTATAGTYIAAYDNGDTVHPSVAGHAQISRGALANGLADHFPPSAGALTSRSSADTSNLFSASGLNRGLFTTNTSGVGTGFTLSGGTATASIQTPTDPDVRGNWQRLARTTGNTGTATLTATISSGWSVGDKLALSFRFVSNGFESTGTAFNVYATQVVSTAIVTPAGNVFAQIAGVVSWHTDHDGLEYVEWTVPPTASTLTIQQSIGAVVGTASPTLDVGELTLRNLTTGNLLL